MIQTLRLALASAAVAASLMLPAAAQQVEKIAAIVNDDVISTSDVDSRLKLVMAVSNLPDSPENRVRLRPQVMQNLIEERLQMQEAARNGIDVEPNELSAAINAIAQQNQMTPTEFQGFVSGRPALRDSLQDKMKAQIAWGKLVQRRLRPSIEISEEQVDAVLERMSANAGKPEYLVAEIYLPVTSAEQDEQMKEVAARLLDQVRSGADFAGLARNFSRSAGAVNGGDLGWIQDGQFENELDDVLRAMKPGDISPPVRAYDGYHILFLRDRRTAMATDPSRTFVDLVQIFLPLAKTAPEAEVTAQLSKAQQIRGQLNGCDSMKKTAAGFPSSLSGDIGRVPLSNLPGPVASAVADLAIGTPSAPLRADNGLAILMVCGREAPDNAVPSRDEITSQLGMQKLDMLQRRYLRDLRLASFVDIRD